MKKLLTLHLSPFLACLLILFVPCQQVIAQATVIKKINITVTDAASGHFLEDAKVNIKGLFKRTKTTDNFGRVTFEIPLMTDNMELTIEVTDGSLISGHKTYTTKLNLTAGQEVYDLPVALRSDYKGIYVTAIDEESRQPVYNAKVTLTGANDGRSMTSQTDGSGNASFEVLLMSKTKDIPVVVEKDGYASGAATVRIESKNDRYSVSVPLKKDKTSKMLKVTLIADDDNSPIPEASVSASGATFNDFYRAASDQSGLATLVMKSGGAFTVSTLHPKFEDARQEITINKFGDEENYSLAFRLKRKKQVSNLDLIVYVKNADENFKPLSNATVKFKSMQATSDYNGKVVFPDAVGIAEEGTVSVSAYNFEPAVRSFVAGDVYRYAVTEHEVNVSLKKKLTDLNLRIEILDERTNKPIPKSAVSLKNSTGKVIQTGLMGASGNIKLVITAEERKNTSFRAIATATGYEEKWSDIPNELLDSREERFYTIYMKKKKAVGEAEEIKFGPYAVGISGWVGTGLRMKKGTSFRVEASGKLNYNKDGSGYTEMSPDGHGYWNWFSLKAKIGKQLVDVGSSGSGTATEDGMLELGAPRVTNFFEGDAAGVNGTWTVYVYAKNVVDEKSYGMNPGVTAPTNVKSTEHLAFLQKLQKGEYPGNRTIDEIIGEVKFIASNYNLKIAQDKGKFEEGLWYIRYYLANVGNVMPKVKNDYDGFVNSMINELQSKISY